MVNFQSAAMHFANEVSRFRSYTSQEQSMVEGLIADSGEKRRRIWTSKDDRVLRKLLRKRMTAIDIAAQIGRTPWSVRNRVRTLKGRIDRG